MFPFRGLPQRPAEPTAKACLEVSCRQGQEPGEAQFRPSPQGAVVARGPLGRGAVEVWPLGAFTFAKAAGTFLGIEVEGLGGSVAGTWGQVCPGAADSGAWVGMGGQNNGQGQERSPEMQPALA